jgi:hypothetical protein
LHYFVSLIALALTPFLHIHWRLLQFPMLLYGANPVLSQLARVAGNPE